jgi:3-phenylpropionate/trans-cinnamate dioxygenase ferredoxin reductase component
MSDSAAGVVIIGAGHAGGTAAAALRQFGYAAPITIVGDEPIAPYQRPPLSKAWLKGEADAEALMLRPLGFYADQKIELILNVEVRAIDRDAKSLDLADGKRIAYDRLIIATGSRARALPVPGADLDGVLFLRSAADAEVLKAALGPGKRLVVIGGGYIGLEAAASGRALGAEVTVIEKEPRLLARVAGETLSDFFQRYHEAHSVSFVLGAAPAGFEGTGGRVTGVRLADGRLLPCDEALIGVGNIPNDEVARAAGLKCDNGVVVDEVARTSDPCIFAIGDVTRRPLALYDGMFRLECVANALEQARQAAAAIAGRPAPPHEVTWNWSDQYDIKLQLAGATTDGDELVLRGDPAGARFAIFHLKGPLVRAVEAVNAPAEFMAGKKLIETQKPIDRARLANVSVSMKEVMAG